MVKPPNAKIVLIWVTFVALDFWCTYDPGLHIDLKPTQNDGNTINHNDGKELSFFLSFFRCRFLQFIDDFCSLWEVCRATAAAPTYFPPAFVTSVDGKFQGTMIDGGAIQNNPVSLP